jgi:hypothetical protein
MRRPHRPSFPQRAEAHLLKPSRRFTLENRRSPPALPQSPAGQCISRLHCENFALRPNQSQRKTIVELCRNCGGWDFLVEREGKPGKNFFHACVGRTLLSAPLEFAVEFAVYVGAQLRRIIQACKSKSKAADKLCPERSRRECPPHAKNKSTAKAVLLKCLPFLSDCYSPW